IHFKNQESRSSQVEASPMVPPAFESQIAEQAVAPLREVNRKEGDEPKEESVALQDDKAPPSDKGEAAPSGENLANRALGYHLAGRCGDALISYRQLEHRSSEQEEK